MKRLAILLGAIAMLHGCAAPSDTTVRGSLPGVTERPGAQCVPEGQQCDRARPCCDGMTCMPAGRFGFLCRMPAPA